MTYFLNKTLEMDFEQAISKVSEELKKEGFGILSEIDVSATLEKKLKVEFPRYTILGACNPPFAYQALQVKPRIGLMLPCNVIVRELAEREIEVAAVDPLASMQAIHNRALEPIAVEIKERLERVVAQL